VGYKVYLKLVNASKESISKFVEYLYNDSAIYWTAISKGKWDFMFGIWAKNIYDFDSIYNKMLDKFSKFIQDKELSISLETLQFNRCWLYNDGSDRKQFTFGEKEEQIVLDSKDQQIINILNGNSRIKLIDLAEKTKLSPKVVAYRIKEMEKKKIIRGYKIFLNPNMVGFNVYKSFVYLKNVNEKRKKEFIDYCKILPNLTYIVLTFAPWDLEMGFETKDDKEYYKIMEDIKEKFNDIASSYDSVLILEEPRHKYLINSADK
jgi:DNA-binding Lrp family transcriptional regulator